MPNRPQFDLGYATETGSKDRKRDFAFMFDEAYSQHDRNLDTADELPGIKSIQGAVKALKPQ